MPGALRAKLASSALVVSAGALLFATPAAAIQTTTWGIQPAAHADGVRSTLKYPSNGQTEHDAVIVYNRTSSPEVIELSVLGATYSTGTYQYTTDRSGLAGRVSLAATRIPLGPHQQARVPVTVRLPRHSKLTTLAAIAAEGAPVKQGSLFVQQRLVLLVEATPTTSAPLVPDIGLWGPVAGALLALVGGLAARELRRRRRPAAVAVTEPSPTEEVQSRMAGVG